MCLGRHRCPSWLDERGHDRLLHVQPVLGFVDRDARGESITASVALTLRRSGRQWLNSAWSVSAILRFVDDEMLVRIANRLLLGPAPEVRNRAPAFRVDDFGALVRLRRRSWLIVSEPPFSATLLRAKSM